MGVEVTPLSIRGEANAEVLLGGETFHVPIIVVDRLSSDAIRLDFLKDHPCTYALSLFSLSLHVLNFKCAMYFSCIVWLQYTYSPCSSPCMQEHTSVKRKHRTPFTLEEEDYVIQGVAKFGKR